MLLCAILFTRALTPDRMCELSKIISISLPVDSQIATTYKAAFAFLSDYNRHNDTPQKVINRIKKIMAIARREIRAANKWQNQGLKFSTDKKDNPLFKALSKGKNASDKSSSNDTTHSSAAICSYCGFSGHKRATCRRLNRPGTNFDRM